MVFWIVLGLCALPLLVGLDRLLLWMEERGWIYYRKSSSGSGSLSGAVFGGIQEIFEPSAVEIRKEIQRQEDAQNEDEDGASPDE
jgi:hypothetical protein